jgi:predicted RNA-binding protein (virulence factor B family)
MARKKTQHDSQPAELPALSRLEQQVMAHLMTAIAFGNYDDVSPAEDLAKVFRRDPKRFKRVINQLVRKGYVTVSGELLETVYPTVTALRQQKPDMSEAVARRILKKLGA